MDSSIPQVSQFRRVGDETYRDRNPLLPVQTSSVHPCVEQSTEEKNRLYQQRKSRRETKNALHAELDAFRADCDGKIKDLSAKYSTDTNKIRNEVYNISSFKSQRKVNTWNAEVSYKAKELRENGEKGGLERARAEVLEDRVKRGSLVLPPEQQSAVMQHAANQRALKQHGARPTNKSAAMDATFTAARVQSELKKLSNRTGAAGLFMITRGHLNDCIAPAGFETDNAAGFCDKALGHNLIDVGTRLESWSILRSQGSNSAHTTKELRKKCVGIIIDGLREITGKDDVAMNYQNYETSIVSRYKVQLVGWPPHIPFSNPSNINTEHLQRLADALQSLECRWQLMTREEVAAHNAKHDTAIANGGRAGKPRKPRSDKNKKRASKADEGNSAKRPRTGGHDVPHPAGTAGTRVPLSRQLPPHIINPALANGLGEFGTD